MLKNRLFYIAVLIITVFIYIFTNTYYTLSLLLFVIVSPLVSLALMLLSQKSITIKNSVRRTMEKGDVRFYTELENKSFLPIARLILTVTLENQLLNIAVDKKVYISLQAKKKTKVHLSVEQAKVGMLFISVEKAGLYDIFGLFSMKLSDIPVETTVVYPKLLDLEVHMDKPVETMGDGNRYAPNKKGTDVSEILALREYEVGDEIKKIHWKLSSKIDKMIVRDFSLPLNYSVFLLVELKRSEENIIDAMTELYLSLSKVLLTEGINHNLAWYDGGSEQFNVHELDDFEDLEIAMAEFLTSFTYEESFAALDHYMTSGYRNNEARLIYMTPELDTEKIEEAEIYQKMKTIYVSHEGLVGHEDALDILGVDPDNMEDGLPEFII